jgi:virulence-associated protein VapD
LDWTTPLLTLATSIAVAVISSILTVRLALRRFYSEKWWERKSAAYTAIIEALHHVREHADTNLTFSLRGKDLPPEGDRELTAKLQDAMAQLRMQRDVGSFVVSEETVNALNNLFAELDASTNTVQWVEHLKTKLAALDKCLPELRRIARCDLQLK